MIFLILYIKILFDVILHGSILYFLNFFDNSQITLTVLESKFF